MADRLKAVAFDLDASSFRCLREVLPEWEIELLKGATATSLTHDWNPGEADLLVVSARDKVRETLDLCRFLAHCEAAESLRAHSLPMLRAQAPLLVLVSPGQEPLVKGAFERSGDSCLVLPVHTEEMARRLAFVRRGVTMPSQSGAEAVEVEQLQKTAGRAKPERSPATCWPGLSPQYTRLKKREQESKEETRRWTAAGKSK